MIADLVVDGLACWRLTHLVTDDQITEPVRDWVRERWPGGRPAYLIDCVYCVGIWAAVTVLVGRGWRPGRWLNRVLAVAAVAPLIEEHLNG